MVTVLRDKSRQFSGGSATRAHLMSQCKSPHLAHCRLSTVGSL